MKTFIPYILTVWLLVGFSLSTSIKVFSQENQKENNSETTATTTNGRSSAVKGFTAGRGRALAGAVVCLISLGIGWRAKIHSVKGIGRARTGAIIALVLGLIGITLSVVHLCITAGAVFGSGSGKAGAIVALVLGLIGVTLAWLALRSLSTD